MNDIQSAYNIWAKQYDTNENKTRDLEGAVLRNLVSKLTFENCLEIGCGTGKNTEFLVTKAKNILAVDFSSEMLAQAKNKINNPAVTFIQADINNPWDFADTKMFELAIFSLVLEHIENLDAVFKKLSTVITSNGYVYIAELHPFKQYAGSKARFETANGLQVLTCFTHNISDFVSAAQKSGFQLTILEEHFDDNDRNNIPRILTLVFKKN